MSDEETPEQDRSAWYRALVRLSTEYPERFQQLLLREKLHGSTAASLNSLDDRMSAIEQRQARIEERLVRVERKHGLN
jgi:hypothetical protein